MKERWKNIFVLFCATLLGLNSYAQERKSEMKTDSTIGRIDYFPPEFPGGHDSMLSFIKRNLKKPDSYIGIQGTVYISTIIDTNGKLTEPKILKGVHSFYDNEALRVIMIMPNWKPYINEQGKPEKLKVTIPIKFILE